VILSRKKLGKARSRTAFPIAQLSPEELIGNTWHSTDSRQAGRR
jgi:hypothetical protein